MEENTKTTQILNQIYNILDENYFHVCVTYKNNDEIEWKIYYKCLIHEDYFSEENSCLLSSDKNTIEDIEKLKSVFEKEKRCIEEKIALELMFSKSTIHSLIKEIKLRINKIIFGMYFINLILWIICSFFPKQNAIGFYGAIIMWLIVIVDLILDKIFNKQTLIAIENEIEDKTRMYIKGLGLKFLERIKIK